MKIKQFMFVQNLKEIINNQLFYTILREDVTMDIQFYITLFKSNCKATFFYI